MGAPIPLDTDPSNVLRAFVVSLTNLALVFERLTARAGEHTGAVRWATSKENPFGKPRPFLEAGRRGDFETFKRGRDTVARWQDVEAYIASRKIERKPRSDAAPSAPITPPPSAPPSLDDRRRAMLASKGLLPASEPRRGAARC